MLYEAWTNFLASGRKFINELGLRIGAWIFQNRNWWPSKYFLYPIYYGASISIVRTLEEVSGAYKEAGKVNTLDSAKILNDRDISLYLDLRLVNTEWLKPDKLEDLSKVAKEIKDKIKDLVKSQASIDFIDSPYLKNLYRYTQVELLLAEPILDVAALFKHMSSIDNGRVMTRLIQDHYKIFERAELYQAAHKSGLDNVMNNIQAIYDANKEGLEIKKSSRTGFEYGENTEIDKYFFRIELVQHIKGNLEWGIAAPDIKDANHIINLKNFIKDTHPVYLENLQEELETDHYKELFEIFRLHSDGDFGYQYQFLLQEWAKDDDMWRYFAFVTFNLLQNRESMISGRIVFAYIKAFTEEQVCRLMKTTHEMLRDKSHISNVYGDLLNVLCMHGMDKDLKDLFEKVLRSAKSLGFWDKIEPHYYGVILKRKLGIVKAALEAGWDEGVISCTRESQLWGQLTKVADERVIFILSLGHGRFANEEKKGTLIKDRQQLVPKPDLLPICQALSNMLDFIVLDIKLRMTCKVYNEGTWIPKEIIGKLAEVLLLGEETAKWVRDILKGFLTKKCDPIAINKDLKHRRFDVVTFIFSGSCSFTTAPLDSGPKPIVDESILTQALAHRYPRLYELNQSLANSILPS